MRKSPRVLLISSKSFFTVENRIFGSSASSDDVIGTAEAYAAGSDATGCDTGGTNTAERDVAGIDVAGYGVVGTNTTERDVAGTDVAECDVAEADIA